MVVIGRMRIASVWTVKLRRVGLSVDLDRKSILVAFTRAALVWMHLKSGKTKT